MDFHAYHNYNHALQQFSGHRATTLLRGTTIDKMTAITDLSRHLVRCPESRRHSHRYRNRGLQNSMHAQASEIAHCRLEAPGNNTWVIADSSTTPGTQDKDGWWDKVSRQALGAQSCPSFRAQSCPSLRFGAAAEIATNGTHCSRGWKPLSPATTQLHQQCDQRI